MAGSGGRRRGSQLPARLWEGGGTAVRVLLSSQSVTVAGYQPQEREVEETQEIGGERRVPIHLPPTPTGLPPRILPQVTSSSSPLLGKRQEHRESPGTRCAA